MEATANQLSTMLDLRVEVDRRYRLSHHLQLRPERQGFVVHSLITGHHEFLSNQASIRLLFSFMAPTMPSSLLERLDGARCAAVLTILGRWVQAGLLTDVDDDGEAGEDRLSSLRHWEPHDLAFHLLSRRGRNPFPVGATWRLAAVVPPEPARRADNRVVLDSVRLSPDDLDFLTEHDWSLTRALEARRSRYSTEPVTIQALSALLFRACRITGGVTTTERSGDLMRKVYPSGGSLHSLELYVIANRCIGLPSGGYRYDGFDHRLDRLRELDEELLQLLRDAKAATLRLEDLPSVLLVFAARFRRVTRKYQSLAYHVILQEVGAAYQTLYLVGETLGLAISAIGSGDSERFARAFHTDFFAESSVGEMVIGARKST